MDMRNHRSWLFLSALSLSLFLNCHTSFGADTISADGSLSGDQTLVSSGGSFVLGFFKPGNEPNYYIGIWYNKISTQTVVWVANRERPVSDKSSAKLEIQNGSLALLEGSSLIPVWSSNSGNPSFAAPQELEAVLLDSGNFVLRNRSKTSEANPIWQSYDYPTHTWLPGSKIGLDKRTGRNQLLTSWKNSEDPSPGLFSLELDPSGSSQYFVLWNRSRQFWTSGPWNGKIFSLVPEMRLNYIYNFSYVSNANESYFIYSVYDSSIISRFIMDVSGQIKQETWLNATRQWNLFWAQPRTQCEVYDFCGAYGTCNQNGFPFCTCLTGFNPKSGTAWGLSDYSGGCVRETLLNCGTGSSSARDKDRFLPSPSVKLPDHPQLLTLGSTEECESACLSNCSCTAYAYGGGGCSIWAGNLLNLQQFSQSDSSGNTLYVRLAASEFPHKSNKKTVIGIAMGSAAGVALLGLVLALFLRWRRKSAALGNSVEGSLVAFGYKDLQGATKNFSEKLGGGGFGSVFKGTLPDSTVVAVKRLESISQGEKQFRTEVSTIGAIQHMNLIRLRGFCSEGANKLLVYDYMRNASLDAHLFRGKDSKVLDWKTRFGIALGTARGLFYLHEKCRDCIIHCDIKPENILLDADFCPKVADFGLAKLVGRDFSRVLTTMRGTRGYLAPEWISGVAITAKADAFSYGMMLLELVSGSRNSEAYKDGKPKFFPHLAANVIAEGGDVLSLLDNRLEGDADSEELTRVCRVACWCVQDDEAHRPSMSQAVQMLEGVLEANVPPVPRSLGMFVDTQENIVFFTESSSSTQSSQTRSTLSASSSQAKSSSTASSSSSKT